MRCSIDLEAPTEDVVVARKFPVEEVKPTYMDSLEIGDRSIACEMRGRSGLATEEGEMVTFTILPTPSYNLSRPELVIHYVSSMVLLSWNCLHNRKQFGDI